MYNKFYIIHHCIGRYTLCMHVDVECETDASSLFYTMFPVKCIRQYLFQGFSMAVFQKIGSIDFAVCVDVQHSAVVSKFFLVYCV